MEISRKVGIIEIVLISLLASAGFMEMFIILTGILLLGNEILSLPSCFVEHLFVID